MSCVLYTKAVAGLLLALAWLSCLPLLVNSHIIYAWRMLVLLQKIGIVPVLGVTIFYACALQINMN